MARLPVKISLPDGVKQVNVPTVGQRSIFFPSNRPETVLLTQNSMSPIVNDPRNISNKSNSVKLGSDAEMTLR